MELIESPTDGSVIDALQTMYPSRLEVVTSAREHEADGSTRYGYVLEGSVRVQTDGVDATLGAGSYFALVAGCSLQPDGVAVVIERKGFCGTTCIGRIERRGRLAYIDGCSDSVLVMPPRRGDPVLNHLHFPSGVKQTQHTHPSIRLGVVARGTGHAYSSHGEAWELPLRPGCVFLLREHEVHAFRTDKSGSTMDVIAYHPDSDWGPTDGAHPMINRTYIEQLGIDQLGIADKP